MGVGVTREQRPGLAGDSEEEPSATVTSPQSLRDKAKCGGSHAAYTFHFFLLSSCPKKKREEWSGEKEREEKEVLISS